MVRDVWCDISITLAPLEYFQNARTVRFGIDAIT